MKDLEEDGVKTPRSKWEWERQHRQEIIKDRKIFLCCFDQKGKDYG